MTKYFLIQGTLLFRGSLNDRTVGYGKDTKERFRFSLKDGQFKNKNDIKEITNSYDVNDKFTPRWVKEYINNKKDPEYINFKSDFPLVVSQRTEQGDVEIDRAEVISGAKGWLSLTLKSDDDGAALYSGQFLMLENGELHNPFEEV